ncbi:MAG TPA: PAS domain S-box protein [Gemmatimonadaceae bacterium]
MAKSSPPDDYVERALLGRLLEEPGAAEASHLLVAALVLALLWGVAPGGVLASWLGAVAAASLIRVAVRRRARKSIAELRHVPAVLRIAIIAVALAWGIGAYIVAPLIPARDLALLMVVLCGLSAAATATLLGDSVSYYGYVIAMLGPLALGVLRVGGERSFVLAFVLLGLFAAVMAMLYRRLHHILVDLLSTAHNLDLSRVEAERERNYLDALIASAPNAIVVLDGRQRVIRVNPEFQRMFGFTADEVMGRPIDELVVPINQRDHSVALAGRVQGGGTVTTEGERQRKDGTTVFVRISAAQIPGRDDATLVIYADITEAKQDELKIRDNEQRLFQTLESLPVGIVVVDQGGAPYFANALAKAMVGRGIVRGADPQYADEVYDIYMAGTDQLYPRSRLPAYRALSGERCTVDDLEIRRPGGAISLETFASPITDASGKVVFGVAAFTDITARKRRAERVAASNAVVRVLAEATAESALLPAVLRAICENLRWDAASIWQVDRDAAVLRLAGFWHGDSVRAVELHRASRAAAFARGEGVLGKIWNSKGPMWIPSFTRDATPERGRAAELGGLISAVGLPLRVAGEVVGILEFFAASMRPPEPELLEALENIGSLVGQALERRGLEVARHEVEAQYRELVEAASDMVWRIDAGGRLTFVNGAAQQIYGIAPAALVGRVFTEFSDPEYLEADRAALVKVFAGGELIDYETVHVDASGVRRHLSTSARPILDAAGAIVGVQGIARDVGERAAARDALRAARDAAEQAAAARSAFLTNMSHEIRTPMNGVLGMAELLLDSELNEEDRRSVEMIVDSGEALLSIINDILDFSKIEAQQMDIERTEFDLPGLVESTVRLFMPKATAQQLELVTDVPDSVAQHVLGDPTRLRQVLTNLVGNAVKFTSTGDIVVSVEPVVGDASNSRLRFSVRDTGLGISRDKLDAIFEPFRQADATTTRKYGGTGLGLSISRRLVELMGGTLAVESREGEGSTFSFELAMPRVASPETPPPVRANLSGALVLVVDDHATNRDLMHRIFARAGCIVDGAPGAGEALALLRAAAERRVPYQLVVTDVFMPVMDGFDFVAAIRGDPLVGDTPVMMVTSAARRGDSQRCRELDIAAFLLKPAGRGELVAAAGAAMGFTTAPVRIANAPHIAVAPEHLALRILLAEDNTVNQEVAATMLRRRGHTVDVVGSGRQAVDAVRAGSYDMVLMDLQMPELDGLQATAEIRTMLAGRPLPIVALTANAMVGERERCLAAGMDGYLAKPFKPHQLFEAVEAWSAGAMAVLVAAGAPPLSGAADAPPVDVALFRAEMRAAGVEEAVAGILGAFRKEAPGRMAALEKAVRDGEGRAIERAAHAFKSSTGAIHAQALAELLRDMEIKAKGGDVAAATTRLGEVQLAFDAVMRQLNSH